jgi:hypothetical protein
MNDESNAHDAAADDQMADQLPAGDEQHPADQYGDQAGDTAAPDGDDGLSLEAWQSVGVEDPDAPPSDPSGYGLVATGDEAVDAALQQMIEADDPELDRFAQAAHQMGLSVKQFSDVVSYYTAQMVHRGVSWDQAAEALGPDADKMLEAVDRWGQVHLSARTRALVQQAEPSPALLAVLSDAMIASGHLAPDQPDDDATPSDDGVPIASKAQVKALMDSEQYRRGDPKTVQAVRASFRKLSEARARGHEPK